MSGPLSRAPGSRLLLLAGVVGVFALFVALTGGIDTRITGVPVRSRSWERPAGLAAVLALAGTYRARRQILWFARRALVWVTAGAPRLVRPLPVMSACAAGAVALAFGTFVAGGADSYGYVSQAELFARGRVTDTVDVRGLNWPAVRYTLAPLGYRPGTAEGVISPLYPPGLPLLMAPFAVVHPKGVFLVVPFCAVLAVWLCFRLGRELAGSPTGAMSALLFAVSPTFLFQAVQPMSDVPAATFWLGGLVLARGTRVVSAAAAGFMASVAILIRPNLAPLALFILATAATARTTVPWRNVLACLAAVLPGVLVLGAIQQVRYGSPLESGYGSLPLLFGWENIVPNLDRYPRWLTDTHTPLVWLWLLAPFWIVRAAREARVYAWICYGFSLAVFVAYLPYVYFQPDEWEYTRFLLPAIPIMLIFMVSVLFEVARRVGHALLQPAAVLLLVAVAGLLACNSFRAGVFGFHETEARYEQVGRFVRDRLPASAFVMAAQHSGSVRYYSGRRTLRWDVLETGSLRQAISSLRASGYTPYAVLDLHEVEQFTHRFATTSADVLERMELVGTVRDTRVYAFR